MTQERFIGRSFTTRFIDVETAALLEQTAAAGGSARVDAPGASGGFSRPSVHLDDTGSWRIGSSLTVRTARGDRLRAPDLFALRVDVAVEDEVEDAVAAFIAGLPRAIQTHADLGPLTRSRSWGPEEGCVTVCHDFPPHAFSLSAPVHRG